MLKENANSWSHPTHSESESEQQLPDDTYDNQQPFAFKV